MKTGKHPRKGQHYQMVSIIALLVFLLITIPLYAKFKGKSSESTMHTACMQSIKYASSFKLDGSEYSKRIKCPMEWHKERAKDKTDAMRKITYFMTSTWDEFQGGKVQLFKDIGKTNYCVFRHIIEFKNPERIGTIPPGDFISYLQGTMIKRNGEETSAYEYFTGVRTGKLYDWSKVEENLPKLNPKEPLAIAVVYSEKGKLNEVFAKAAGTGAGIGIAAGIGVTILAVATGGLAIIPLSATALTVTAATAGGTAGAAAGGAITLNSKTGISSEHDAGIVVLPYTEDWLKKLNCDFLPGEQNTGRGGEK